MAKEFYHNRKISEGAIRGQYSMNILDDFRGILGVVKMDEMLVQAGRWQNRGVRPKFLLEAVKCDPLGIPLAVQSVGIEALRKASRYHPAILFFDWENSPGGHIAVCVGPTKIDNSIFVMLDPEYGLQYLSADDVEGNSLVYYAARNNVRNKARSIPWGYISTV